MSKRKECSKVESTFGAISTKATYALAAKDNRSPITGEASLTSSAWKSYPTMASPIRTLCPRSAGTCSSGLARGSNKAVESRRRNSISIRRASGPSGGGRLFHRPTGQSPDQRCLTNDQASAGRYDGPIFSTVAKLVVALKRSIPERTENAERKKEALCLGRDLLRGTKYDMRAEIYEGTRLLGPLASFDMTET